MKRANDIINKMNWTELYSSQDVNYINHVIESRISEVLNAEAPLRKIQVRTNFRKWIDHELKGQMKDRDIIREQARRSGARTDWEIYRRTRNNVTKATRKARSDHYSREFEKLAAENDTKNIFKVTRELCGWNRTSGPKCFIHQ